MKSELKILRFYFVGQTFMFIASCYEKIILFPGKECNINWAWQYNPVYHPAANICKIIWKCWWLFTVKCNINKFLRR